MAIAISTAVTGLSALPEIDRPARFESERGASDNVVSDRLDSDRVVSDTAGSPGEAV